MKCKTCRFCRRGECRIARPVAVILDGRPHALWPPVQPHDFCGEYEQERK